MNELHKKQLQELTDTVNRLMNANQELSSIISKKVAELTDSVRAATVEEVNAALNADKQELAAATLELHTTLQTAGDNMEKSMDEIQKKLSGKLDEQERKQRHFFAMDGIKHFVFWAMPVMMIAETILLVWFLFFK